MTTTAVQRLESPRSTQPNPRNPTLALVVISLAQLMLVLDELIVNTALPHIQRALGFSGSGLEWVVTAYAVTFGGLLLLGGRCGDILGRRNMFVGGIALFTAASFAGGLAPHSSWLIAARTVQGVGAAFAAPAALSLIAVTFPEGHLRERALAVYAAMTGMGGAVGLVAGGVLTTYFSWRWVFFVNVPLGVVLVVGAFAAIPESSRHRVKWDLPGAVFGTAGLALLIFGLTHGAKGPDGVAHWDDPATLTSLSGAAVALVALVVAETRADQPLLPLWILRNRNRLGVYVILLCLAAAFFAMFFFVTQFLQVVWGYSAIKGGLAYLPFIGAFVISAGINTKLMGRIGPRLPLTVGTVIAPFGMFWLSRVSEQSSYLTGICLPFIVFAFAAGLIFVPLTSIVVAGIEDRHAGIASSMFNAGQQVGGAVGLAVIGSVAWTVVNNQLDASSTVSVRGTPVESRAEYAHALTQGVATALTLGFVATLLAFVVCVLAIRVRRIDVPSRPALGHETDDRQPVEECRHDDADAGRSRRVRDQVDATATTGAVPGVAPSDPKKGDPPKSNVPPSAATSA